MGLGSPPFEHGQCHWKGERGSYSKVANSLGLLESWAAVCQNSRPGVPTWAFKAMLAPDCWGMVEVSLAQPQKQIPTIVGDKRGPDHGKNTIRCGRGGVIAVTAPPCVRRRPASKCSMSVASIRRAGWLDRRSTLFWIALCPTLFLCPNQCVPPFCASELRDGRI